MERKLIAIDLDGTTLNNYSQVAPETELAIKQVIELGHIVSIVTGRPYRSSKQFYEQLNLDTPIVNFNGAWCHYPNHPDWKNAYHKQLDRELALSFLSLSRFPIVKLISAETHNQIYVDRMDESPYNNVASPIRAAHTIPFSEDGLTENPTSVNVFTAEEYFIPFMQDTIIKEFGDQVEVRTWGGPTPTLEIVDAGIQKAMGVEAIAKFYDISPDNIIAFGDEANDYEMIQYAGRGVVMKNGIDGLKEISDDITSHTNDEQGLAKYLIKYFDLV